MQRPTTGAARATTTEIARQRLRSRDNGSWVGRQWVADRATTGPTPRGRVAATVYKGGRLDRDSRSNYELLILARLARFARPTRSFSDSVADSCQIS